MQQVECRQIRHSYDGVRDAVTGLDLTIKRGEVLALIGPNGAGKSTTLRILATLQRPDAGSVHWDGQDAWAQRLEIRRRVGFLGDGTALYPTMTAAGYLRFFAECYGQADDVATKRVAELLAMFDLASKANARIGEMSKGMRQRLAIARAMIHDPELLLLDEPADGLDPLARRQLRDILRAVADRGVGIVVSSHILRELDGFVDSVALIQKGKLEVHGSVDDVIAKYEVGRRLHEVHVTRGLQTAIEVLRKRGPGRAHRAAAQGRAAARPQDRRSRPAQGPHPRQRRASRAPAAGARARRRRGHRPREGSQRPRGRLPEHGPRRGELIDRDHAATERRSYPSAARQPRDARDPVLRIPLPPPPRGRLRQWRPGAHDGRRPRRLGGLVEQRRRIRRGQR
ncbi:MAG: ABC transporter ATP-binding protein [Deltaproteobacteria bacterium]|nr:ABC transporter ATP-binding protein [Deltaproteobacteria bacterium]